MNGHPTDDVGASKRMRLTATGWLAVVLLLVMVDVLVRQWFVPKTIVPLYAPPSFGLRDRTAGQNFGILFDMTQRHVATHKRTAVLVGDSTVSIGLEEEPERLASYLGDTLANHGIPNVDVIEFAALGLPASDAAVLIAKALALHVDLVVYSMTPRIICVLSQTATDAARYGLDMGVTSELGPGFVWDEFALADLATSAVRSHWQLLTYRNEIAAYLLERIRAHAPTVLAPYVPGAPPPVLPTVLREAGQNEQMTGPLWTREHCSLEEGRPLVRALEKIFAICGTTGRCLPYEGPLNPLGRSSFDPGLPEDFHRLLVRLAREHDVPLLDYRALLPPEDFREPFAGHIDAIHMNPHGKHQLSLPLGTEAARRLAAARSS